MAQIPEEIALPPSLKLLRALVIVLMLSMIGGVITVVALLVTRLQAPNGQSSAPPPALPANITLPAGEIAEAVTMGKGWIAVVTASNRILILNADGTLLQTVEINGN